MKSTWIVVAESSRAKIYEAEHPRGAFSEKEVLVHTEGRLHEQQLTSDLPGRNANGAGMARHSMDSNVSPKEQEAIDFAKTVCKRLDAARARGQFEKLVLMAPPHFLGHLRKNISTPTRDHIILEIAKNLVRHATAEVRQHVIDAL